MKSIKLKQIQLTHFKGQKNLTIEFSDETNIFGANGTGKTTIFDAFTWLLFGKDSTDRKDFEIKTLDNSGNAIPKIDHEVLAIIEVNSDLIEIRRVFSEKWVTQRGETTPVFSGHETTFYWDGVPLKQSDYLKKVADICDEFIFKLITSPTAFNNIKWTERREILMKMAGEVTNEELAGENPNYLELIAKLSKYNSEDDYKKMLQASIKKAKEEIAFIPSRIDEVEKSKPEAEDFKSIQEQIIKKESLLKSVDEKIENSTKAYQSEIDKINAHNRKILDVQREVDNLNFEIEREAKKAIKKDSSRLEDFKLSIDNLTMQRDTLQRKLDSLESDIKNDEAKIKNITIEMDSKRNEWAQINSESCKDSTHCPSCEQPLPEEKVNEIIDRFKSTKNTRLNNISEYGKKLSEEKKQVEARLENSKTDYSETENKLSQKNKEIDAARLEWENELNALNNQETIPLEDAIKTIASEHEEFNAKTKELQQLKDSVPGEPNIDISAYKTEKTELQNEINRLNAELAKETQIKKANERIQELDAQEKELAQQISNVDKEVFLLEEFKKLKVDEIEKRIRGLFSFVSFRMFREQINGGLEPACDVMIDGVPFSDANTASKINAGIDIINALSKFYGVNAPIFIDNRESVTEVLDTQSQLINLIVSPDHKKITVEAEKLQESY